jgi:L-asparaginase
MPRVVVVTTGGTIASRSDVTGAKVASAAGNDLVARVAVAPGVDVEVRPALSVNSFALTLTDMDLIRRAVSDALADEDVDGIVVTHGTDTMEETAFLVEQFHLDSRPVVFTGAQRSADDPDGDGPANLRDAITTAGARQARNLGVLVVFDGTVHTARGTRKTQTQAAAAFADPDRGPLGHVNGDSLVLHGRPPRTGPLPAPVRPLGEIRVDIVAIYPGVDRTALDAHVGRGADGLVLEATGIGNATVDVVEAVEEHVAGGVTVLLSTRVHAGPVHPVYGGDGGGRDLVAAGAIPTGYLRPSQARMRLIALLAAGADPAEMRSRF